MSKPKPPRNAIPPTIGQVTAKSAASAIIGEKIKIQLEIMRRREYQELLTLRAKLAELPPAPAPHGAPANED